MIVTFDEKADAWRITINETVNGKRIRKTKRLPRGIGQEKAYLFAARMMTTPFPFQDSLARSIIGQPKDVGSVYVLKNEFLRGVVKIGLTRRNVYERIRNLSTAHPGNFTIVDTAIFNHVGIVEMALHRLFDSRREQPRREFFTITEGMAISAMNACREVDELRIVLG